MAEQYQLFVLECQEILKENPYFLGSRGFVRWLKKKYPYLAATESVNTLCKLVHDVNEVERRLARTS